MYAGSSVVQNYTRGTVIHYWAASIGRFVVECFYQYDVGNALSHKLVVLRSMLICPAIKQGTL